MDALSRLIEFNSPAFPFAEEDEELVNSDNMRGFNLAEHIAMGLKASGYDIDFVPEDWGWLCQITNTDIDLWYGVSADAGTDDFIVQFHPEAGVYRRWSWKVGFRKMDASGPLRDLQEAVFAILAKTEPRANGPEWIV